MQTIKIIEAIAVTEREPLLHPFGFKGGSLSELWQIVVRLKSDRGYAAIGLGVQSVLWSDPDVFAAHTEMEGNERMYMITRKALELIQGISFDNPVVLLETIFDEVYAYGKEITGKADLRKTFILNALVPVDNALWLLYAYENKMNDFETMLAASDQSVFFSRHDRVASIPAIGYGTQDQEIKRLLEKGYFVLKIKIGHPGTAGEMLELDKAWMTHIHHLSATVRTPYTRDGKILYYLDANGRYQDKETLARFLDHMKIIGALDQVMMLEEPFPESYEVNVSDVGVRIAADESAHTDKEVVSRIQMGYGAIALKPVAKTLSMTLKILAITKTHDIPCFCADLTANPVLVEWNKNVAARLRPFPGLAFNLLETNGQQNYKNWNTLCSYNPSDKCSWTKDQRGIFELDDVYYEADGGVFQPSEHYLNLFNQ